MDKARKRQHHAECLFETEKMNHRKVIDLRTFCRSTHLPIKHLTYFAYYARTSEKYHYFKIKKSSGEERAISAPHPHLKTLQQGIARYLQHHYKPSFGAQAYISGGDRGLKRNATLHKNKRWLARIDLTDFFGSISKNRVRGLFLYNASSSYKTLCFDDKAAEVLARVCTDNDALPQGAPTSPIISNFIGTFLDNAFEQLTKRFRVTYTRYADDIFLSTNARDFPAQLLRYSNNRDHTLIPGEVLQNIIDSTGFKINDSKLSLHHRSQRHIVTGIITNNAQISVPREYKKQVRAMLYWWKKHGLEKAQARWLQHEQYQNKIHNQKGHLPSRQDPQPPLKVDFKKVVKGKIEHIRHISGENNLTYMKFATQFNDLVEPKFHFKVPTPKTEEITLHTEGKTDGQHIHSALAYFQQRGEFESLALTHNSEGAKGWSDLKTTCEKAASLVSDTLHLFIFDADVPEAIKFAKGTGNKDYKRHSTYVYSLVIPKPDHLDSKASQYCIENLYKADEVKQCFYEGRRLYFPDEFNEKNFLKTDSDIRIGPKKISQCILDQGIYDRNQRDLALSKATFADCIQNNRPGFSGLSRDGFRPLFAAIESILEDFKS